MAIAGVAYAISASAATITAMGIGYYALGFALNMIIASVISKALFSPSQPSFDSTAGSSPNLGNRQQIAPATDNKLAVVYGTAFVGGTIIDLSISEDNQNLYYVMALSEVTGTETGQTVSTFSFGNIYWGGKLVNFQANGYTVASLTDQSTGLVDSTVNGLLEFYLYNNGSSTPTNSPFSAIDVMTNPYLVYKWDASKTMTNTVFAIIHIAYNTDANLTGIQPTKFQITNNLTNTGAVIYDYLLNTRYGGAIPAYQIDTTSLNALTAYSNENFTYTPYTGGSSTQPRFKFNGVVVTSRSIMQNLQDMASCCDCLIKYSEMLGTWGVIVQSPSYTVAMALNDSNIISGITTNVMDIANSFNVAEVKFPDNTAQDSFASSVYDLAVIDPALLYPNEPVNQQSISLPLTNNSVTAQYLATRFLKSAREDLQLSFSINYTGLQLDAGDIVTVTNANYGWVNKLFRCMKVTQTFSDDGQITTNLNVSEFNPAVYDDTNITQFTPSPNTGIGSPTTFGTIYPPTISNVLVTATRPSFQVNVTSSSAGLSQYAEIWYSAFSNPTLEQRIFAGTTVVQPAGNPYSINIAMPAVTLTGISAGNWYFFVRMVNSLATSNFSSASAVLNWRPQTFQYINRYINVVYGDSITGTGFSLNPRNKSYYGLLNNTSATPSMVASDYQWYQATPAPFSTDNYVLFSARGNRVCSFAVDNAVYIGIGGAFVPSESAVYDQTIWNGLEDGINAIDLDARSGQVTKVGTSSTNSSDGILSVTNNTNGTMRVALQKFLNFGNGVYSKTVVPANLTIDVFGRVVGFTQEDDFFFTETNFTATGGQTSFSVTHIVGQVLVFKNGVLLNTADYTETSTTVVLTTGASVGEIITTLNMRAVSNTDFYEPLEITIASSTSNTVTYNQLPFQLINVGDELSFSNTGTVTTFTVSVVDYLTKSITFSDTLSGATAGLPIFRFRAQSANYPPFSRWTVNFSATTSYTPTTFLINSGFEQIYVNGSQFNEIDYNLANNLLDGFPSAITGSVDIIQFSANNLGVPCSNITNTVVYSESGTTIYTFASNPLAMAVYANGVMLIKGAGLDYTATNVNFVLTTAFSNSFTLLNQQTFARIGSA
tara:strand:- start:1542 stop:4871 length:3330 start_codon:yes stop_codon:yes gene_type:complete